VKIPDVNDLIRKLTGIRPDDYCWCGSGRKYRYCHSNRHRQNDIPSGLAGHRFLMYFKSGRCLHPDRDSCSGPPVRSHSVQRAQSLSSISEAGHVLGFRVSFKALSAMAENGFYPPDKIGINQATTFMGFCQKHDATLFEPIEGQEVLPDSEQACLLAFRAMSRELITKENALRSLELVGEADKGRPVLDQVTIQDYKRLHQIGMEKGLEDLLFGYERLKNAIVNREFDTIAYLALVLDRPPEIMCSSVFQIDYDFEGNRLQDLVERDEPAEWVALNALSSGERGLVVFTWMNDFSLAVRFIISLMNQSDIPNCIVRLIFDYIENHAFSPSWWRGQSIIRKKTLCNRAFDVYHHDHSMQPTHLYDDNKNYVNWHINEERTNSRELHNIGIELTP
jgi:hypothetical protein